MEKLAATPAGNDWSSSVQSTPRTPRLPVVSSSPSSPATERVERLLRQFKIHLHSTSTSTEHVSRLQDDIPRQNKHVVCELELWNVVNEELHSINYKPVAFTADHTSLSSDHLIITLTASTIARHTVSNLIRECLHRDEKIKSLKQKISSLEGTGVGGQGGEGQTTPRRRWGGYGHDQSTPLIPPSLSGTRLEFDHSSVVARLEREKQQLREELAARPDLEEFRASQNKVKDLMKQLQDKKSHMSELRVCKKRIEELTSELQQKEESRPPIPPLKLDNSTDGGDGDLVKEVQELLSVRDRAHIVEKLQDIMRTLDNHYVLEKHFSSLLHVVYHHSVPELSPRRWEESGAGSTTPHHSLWCEITWQQVTETLKTWAFYMRGIQELQDIVEEVCEHLDSKPTPHGGSHGNRKRAGIRGVQNPVTFTCQELAVLLRRWLLKKSNLNSSSQQLLVAMVRHFQHLFNVPRLEGVYPAMSVLYQKNVQCNTVLTRLRECLRLDGGCSSHQILNMVEFMMKKDNIDCLAQIHRRLGPMDSAKLVEKFKLCDEFFPSFQRVVTEMQRLLGVDSLSGLVPAIKELQKKSTT